MEVRRPSPRDQRPTRRTYFHTIALAVLFALLTFVADDQPTADARGATPARAVAHEHPAAPVLVEPPFNALP